MTASQLRARLARSGIINTTQAVLGLSYVGLAAVLAANGDTFNISQSYTWFRERMTEGTAAFVLLVAGLAPIATLLAPQRKRWGRLLSMGVLGLFAALSIAIAHGFYRGSSISLETMMFVCPFALLALMLALWRAEP